MTVYEKRHYWDQCIWCSDTVVHHSNGDGDYVLFDNYEPPWELHGCWEERYPRGVKFQKKVIEEMFDINTRQPGHLVEIDGEITKYETSFRGSKSFTLNPDQLPPFDVFTYIEVRGDQKDWKASKYFMAFPKKLWNRRFIGQSCHIKAIVVPIKSLKYLLVAEINFEALDDLKVFDIPIQCSKCGKSVSANSGSTWSVNSDYSVNCSVCSQHQTLLER